MKLVAYCRVSTYNQEENTSLVDQQSRITAWCQALGHELVEVFVEVGSGKSTQRKEYQRMLTMLPEVDGIIALKLDRLSRSVRDLLALVEDTLLPSDKALILVQDQVDTSTPAGRMVLTVMAAMAQLEREMINQRTKAGTEAAKAQGKHTGGGERRFGYKYDRVNKKIQPDPEEQAIISLMFELKAQGLTQKEISDELTQRGVRTRTGAKLSQSKVCKIMAKEGKPDKPIPKDLRGKRSGIASIDPSIISLIWQLSESGMRQRDIADHLNSLGYKSKRGGKFRQDIISRILADTASQSFGNIYDTERKHEETGARQS